MSTHQSTNGKDTDFATPSESTVINADGDGHFKLNKFGKVKIPRRIIHCSDGILEEYSTDEEDEDEPPPPPPVDTSKLTWGPFLWYYAVRTAFGGLAVCDYLGEKLAYFFGITGPKYQYAITEWERMQEEDNEEDELEQQERVAENKMIREATITREEHNSMQKGDMGKEEKNEVLDLNTVQLSTS